MRLLIHSLILLFIIVTVQFVSLSPPTYAQIANKITPSEAASIARESIPDATVVGVKLMPDGVYAVTVRAGSTVERIMVDADSGAIR